MLDLSGFRVSGTNNPGKQVSVTRWNLLLDAIEDGVAGGASAESGKQATSKAGLAALPAASIGEAAWLLSGTQTGLFELVDYAASSAEVAADTTKAVFVRSTANSAFAWRRHMPGGRLEFDWFGAVSGDYAKGASPDCLPAFEALKSFIKALSRNKSVAYQAAGPEVLFPGAQYYFSDTLLWDVTMRWRGMGSGYPGGEPTWLRWPADKGGILTRDTTTSAAGSILEGFLLQGGGGSVSGVLISDLLKSGIRMLSRIVVRDVTVRNFAGAGICISAAVGGADVNFTGNANNWRVDLARVQHNKTGGLYVSGGDANAGIATAIDASYNGRYGIFDASFLGNTYIGCHTDANGLPSHTGTSQVSLVSYGGQRYYLKRGATVEIARATQPGTNSTVWVQYEAGGPAAPDIPGWSNAGNFVDGGSYGGAASFCSFLGCYYETGQAPPQLGSGALVIAGFMGAGVSGEAPQWFAGNGGTASQKPFYQLSDYLDGSKVKVGLGGLKAGNWHDVLTSNSSSATGAFNPDFVNGFALDKVTGDWVFAAGGAIGTNNGIDATARLTTETTSRSYGRDTAGARRSLEVPQLALGRGDAARIVTMASSSPNADPHGLGEIVFNDGSATPKSQVTFWECVAAGTPGTWMPRKVGGAAVFNQGGNYTPALPDADGYIRFTSGATLTLPSNSNVPFPVGTVIEFEQASGGDVLFAAGSGAVVNKRGAVTKTAGQYAVAFAKKVAADEWLVGGDLA